MIKHIVCLDLPVTYDASELADVMTTLEGLQAMLQGFIAFAHGPNRDVEGLSPDCAYGFICTFSDMAALQAYHTDPVHKRQGERLISLCGGDIGGITVVDLEVGAH